MTTTKKATTARTKKPATLKVVKEPQSIPNLPANPFIFEIFELCGKQRSKAKKVEVLQKYAHPSLKTIFIWNFDDTVQSVLPLSLIHI